MQATSSLDHSGQLADLERESSILKLALHITLAKVAQVAALAGTAAVTLSNGKFGQRSLARTDLLLVAAKDGVCLVLGALDAFLAPGRRAAAVFVLDQEVGGTDLALGDLAWRGWRGGGGRVVCGHVPL